MHYKLIGCKIFEREIASVIYQCKNKIDLTLLRQKLHDRPQNLKEIIQAEIDAIDADSHRYSNTTSNTTTYHSGCSARLLCRREL